MTLDEAIEYFRLLSKEDAEKAEELQAKQFINFCEVHRHKKNSTDHLQLAGWLRELKERRNAGWISCKERMPKESGTYICAAKSAGRNIVTFVKWQPRYKQWDLTGARSYWQITHWQPLPEPPKE